MSKRGWRWINTYEKILSPRGGTAMAEQVQSVEESRIQKEDSTATTLAEFARLLYRVANDVTNEDDHPESVARPHRES